MTATGTRLTVTQLTEKYPDMIKQCAENGTGPTLRANPNWEKVLLGRGEPKQILYTAVNKWRTDHNVDAPKAAKVTRRATHVKLPKNITVEQRDQVIRFIKGPDYPELAKWERLAKAIEKYCPGKIQIDSSASSTVHRWYGYIGRPGYDPDLKEGAPAQPRQPEQTEQPAERIKWTQARKDEFTRWLRDNRSKYSSNKETFIAGTKALGISLQPTGATMTKYFKLAAALPASTRNGHSNGTIVAGSVRLLGRDFSLEELEAIVKYAQSTKPLKFCPECGHPLEMHGKAYSIAAKHSFSEH